MNYSGQTMGTTYHVTAGVKKNQDPVEKEDLEYVLSDINRSLSTYIPTSLISRINASRDTSETHALDLHFMNVYSVAKEVYDATQGAFNPAVGPLVRAWGFAGDDPMDLDSSQVADLQRLVDFSAFEVFTARKPVLKKHLPGAELDFNAIAKGYAVDEVGRLLEGAGIVDYLVEIGGEVRARGRHPDGRMWRVGIEKPLAGERDIETVVELNNVSLATSGNYRNFYVRNGQKFVHTINPMTGYPEMNRLLSASVMSPECITADAFATALMVMGFERSISFAREPAAPDMYLIAGGDTTAFEIFATDGFSRFLADEKETP